VVITGVGLLTPLGIGTETSWEGLRAGRIGIGPITQFDAAAFSCRIAGEVKGFDPARYIEKKEIKKMGRFIQFAIAASECALSSSGFKVVPENAEQVGVYIGSGIGGFEVIEREHQVFLEQGPRRISPFFIPATIVNLASGQVSICGGTEACITPMGIGGFAAMRALSTRNDEPERASRPWDRDRDGFVVGEGAGILILEELESARRRNARILAELVGYGMSADAFHVTAPPADGDGAFRVMRNALRDAGIAPEQVQYVNAHGTSTEVGDRIETEALKRAFGEHAYKLAISSTKSMTGHLLGGAGGLEAGITVLSIRDQIAPPTMNHDNPDPLCDLDYVPNQARPMKIDYALSNSFGFGGTNGCLIFKRYQE
jgi:3-oxoacyl-[acyl-carrier-protein] synthase II